MAKYRLPPAPPGYKYIFRGSRYCPAQGRVIFASEFGLRGFPILVRK